MIASGIDLVLDVADASLTHELMQVWEEKRERNILRTTYYEGKNALKDFGISLPPSVKARVETALGWSSTGVQALTDRTQWEDFVSADGSDDPFELSEVLHANRFRMELPQALTSSAIHACSFYTVTRGDVQSGEPEVLMLARAADDSAALWDTRRRCLRGFLSVIAVDDNRSPTELVVYTPFKVITLTKGLTRWLADVRANPLNEVTVAPLVYKPELKRPFGHSRITRASMSHVDSAIRTIVRSEFQAEVYGAPEYWLFGADPQQFGGDKWKAVMGRLKAIERDENDQVPEIHRFAGESPEPHIAQLRMWASLFAGDQGLSVSSLGIVHDNPSSAQAIYAAKEDLIMDAKNAQVSWGYGAVHAAQLAVRLRDGLSETPAELRRLSAMFTNPATVSPTDAADAFSKRAASIPGFAESEVGLELAGLTREQIIRFQAERRRSSVAQLVAGVTERANAARQDPTVAELAVRRDPV